MGNDGGWVLPSVVDPEDTFCFRIQVPNDQAHIAAFVGALWELQYWFNWQHDDLHSGTAVAQVWRRYLDAAIDDMNAGLGCGDLSQLQFQQDECGLQVSFNGGTTWTTIYDPTTCIATGVQDGIVQAISDGLLQQAGDQQSPQAPPSIGACRTYHVVLDADKKWNCPSPIASGDTIQILTSKGGWSDGSLLGALSTWFCPDGLEYQLGSCQGTTHTDSGDPMPTQPHMIPVGHFDSTWFNPATIYTVPTGHTSEALEIQANDGTLSDNLGSIEFDVEICSGGSAWCYHVDFRLSDGGFVDQNTGEGVYVSGVGWQSTKSNGSYATIVAKFTAPSSTRFTRLRCAGTSTINGVVVQHGYINSVGDFYNTSNQPAANWSNDGTVTRQGTELMLYYGPGLSTSGVFVVQDAWIYGLGYNPFGTSNC